MARWLFGSTFLLAWACQWLIGCGGSSPIVQLRMVDDGSTRPCLGAAHLEIEINNHGEMYKADYFGQFFKEDTFACASAEYAFPNLPLGSGLSLSVSMYDSTTDNLGLLCSGQSKQFNVSSGSPNQRLEINLSRRGEVTRGTIIVRDKPPDWGNVQGIMGLNFKLFEVATGNRSRGGYIAYDSTIRPDPFPIIISDLPEPVSATEYRLELTGSKEDGTVLRTWTGIAVLQVGTLSKVQLSS